MVINPPSDAALSPDGLHTVWASADGRSIFSANRMTNEADWAAPDRLLTTRGKVGKIVFAPDGQSIAYENPRCGSAPKRDPALMRRRRLKLFKKAIFGEVPIGADRDPAQLEIPEQLEVFSADIMGSRSGAYPHSGGRGYGHKR